MTAREVHLGVTLRLAGRSRSGRALAAWQRINRIKHDRDGCLCFIGDDETVLLGRWEPGTRFECQLERPEQAGGATIRLDSAQEQDTVWKLRRTKRKRS